MYCGEYINGLWISADIQEIRSSMIESLSLLSGQQEASGLLDAE